jgi:lipopolysaccharide/colanic/teichoic acid biosynthesis glycosyltransferase
MKRLFDVFVSVITVIALLPIFIIVSFFIKMTSPGKVIYRGVRAGKNEVDFEIYKFRTMVENAENIGGHSTSINDFRLTKIGHLLRKYKLDELPQFINVIKGDMSLVGPRPQVLYYTNQYKGKLKSILSVKPGITDLASLYFSDMDKVLGRGSVDKKYESEIEPVKNLLRLQYVNEQSFMLDMRILIETAFSIVGIKNITRLNINP